MKNSNYLWNLINALKSSEKRYFNLWSSAQNARSSYAKLFNFLGQFNKPIDDELIKKKLQGNNFHKNLRQTKRYLYDQILKFLRLYNEEKQYLSHAINFYHEGEILLTKGLYEQSYKRLLKSKKKALEYQQWDIALKVNLQLVNRIHQKLERSLDVKIQDLLKENNFYLQQYRREQQYSNIFYKLFILHRTRSLPSELWNAELDEIANHSELVTLPPKPSFFCEYYYYSTWALIFRLKDQKEKAFKFQKKLIDLWNDQEVFQKIHREKYRISLANYLNSSHSINKHDNFKILLDRLESLKVNGFDEEAEAFQNIQHLKLLHALNRNYTRFEELKKEKENLNLQNIKKGLQIYEAKINSGRKFVIKINAAIFLFAAKEYHAASEWGLEIWNDSLSEHRLDVQIFGKIIYIICFYELNKNKASLEALDLKREALYKYVRSKYSNPTENKKTESFISRLNSLLYILIRQNGLDAEHKIFSEFLDNVESVEIRINPHLKFAFDFVVLWAQTYKKQSSFWILMNE